MSIWEYLGAWAAGFLCGAGLCMILHASGVIENGVIR